MVIAGDALIYVYFWRGKRLRKRREGILSNETGCTLVSRLWAYLDGGVNGIKGVKGGTFYLQHPNMRIKRVEVNILPPNFLYPSLGVK